MYFILYFVIIYPNPSFDQTSPNDTLCKFIWNGSVFLGKKIFKMFAISLLSPIKVGRGPSYTCLPLAQWFCVKYGWNWLSGSEGEDF